MEPQRTEPQRIPPSLNRDIYRLVLLKLGPIEILKLCRTNKLFSNICYDDRFWANYIKDHYMIEGLVEQTGVTPRNLILALRAEEILQTFFIHNLIPSYDTMILLLNMNKRDLDKIILNIDETYLPKEDILVTPTQLYRFGIIPNPPNISFNIYLPRPSQLILPSINGFLDINNLNKIQENILTTLERQIKTPTLYYTIYGPKIFYLNPDIFSKILEGFERNPNYDDMDKQLLIDYLNRIYERNINRIVRFYSIREI